MSRFRLAAPAEPAWHDLGDGVEVLVRPLTTASRIAIELEVNDAIDALRQAGTWPESLQARTGIRSELQAVAMARHALLDWRGVYDAADQALPYAPGLAELFGASSKGLDLWLLLTRPARDTVAEGNGSAPSPNGGTAEALPTAQAASDPLATLVPPAPLN